jgi:BASS family bile acid:Na+ symporter
MASNVMCYLARADVAYSIAITSLSTLISPLVTPLLVFVYAHTLIKIKFMAMFISIIKMVIIPLFLGFILRRSFKKAIERFEYIFPAFSTVFIALICGLVIALNRSYIMGLSALIFAAVALHNIAGVVAGYTAGRIYGFDVKKVRTLSIEVGMQNAGLGAVLALKHFSSQTALPNVLFATWCIITASILAEIWSKKNSRDILTG